MTRQEVLDALRQVFATQGKGVVAAWLFGSRARGDDHAGSDVDVGVVLESGRPRTLEDLPTDLHAAIEERLGLPTDLVVLDGAPPDLTHRVLRDGILVHEGEHERRLAWEIRARNEYFDLQPMLRRYRAALIDSA